MKCKRAVSLVAILLLVLSLFAVPAAAEESSGPSRHNVMLVIDGSGSLVSGNATDPKGLRYDAIDLFLALLTDSGNNVGAIVFDHDPQNFMLDTGLESISGKKSKLDLSQKIRNAQPDNGDTDIGSALLAAVEKLQAEQGNGLPSAIILFSDGRTDLGGDEKAEKNSLMNKDKAITLAQELKIPVHSVCLNASSVADPAELKEISDRTSGSFVDVDKAEDLTKAFESFYSLIFESPSQTAEKYTFSQDGKITFNVDIPVVGAEEANLILKANEKNAVSVSTPSGKMSDQDITDATMTGGPYDIVKLVNPEAGRWGVELTGTPGKDVLVNVIYNVDTTVGLKTEDGANEYGAGENVKIIAEMFQDGKKVEDASVLKEYKAILKITNKKTGEESETEMQAGEDGSFTAQLSSKDKASFDLRATLSFSNLKIKSNNLTIDFGNSAPVPDPENEEYTVRAIVTPVTGRSKQINIHDLFHDAQGDDFNVEIESSQLRDGTYDLTDGVLNVDTAHSRSGDVVIKAVDSEGATGRMTIHFKVTNMTLPIFIAIVVGILALIALILKKLKGPTWTGGILTVTSIGTDYEITNSSGSFSGKKYLKSFLLGNTGIDENSYFKPKSRNQLEFYSKTPVYVNGQPETKVTIFGEMDIFADPDETTGIRVLVQDPNFFFN